MTTVGFQTTNDKKLAEYRDRLSDYNISVEQIDNKNRNVQSVLQEDDVDYVFVSSSDLYEKGDMYGTDSLDDLAHLKQVENRGLLTVYWQEDDDYGVRLDNLTAVVPGYIDRTRRQNLDDEEDVFDWDDLFVHEEVDLSYHELKQRGLKLSVRDKLISQFVEEFLHYDELLDLNHRKENDVEGFEPDRPIDFDVNPVDYVRSHRYFGEIDGDLKNLTDKALEIGLFFRSAKNRRHKIYWLPGLNAGVPFMAKDDPEHEATFQIHDIMHFVFPDLIPDGSFSDEAERVYVMYRMMSEAFSLVLADMLFADEFEGMGHDRIYPLYEDMTRGGTPPLEDVLYATARCALLGDETYLLEMGVQQDTLDHFRDKFDQFFISDYRWTITNFRNMKGREAVMSKWYDSAIGSYDWDLNLTTVGEYVDYLNERDVNTRNQEWLFESIFESYQDRLHSILSGSNRPSDRDSELMRRNRTNAFKRWMIGQSCIFDEYDFVSGAEDRQLLILDFLHGRDEITPDERRRVRSFYEQFVDKLRMRDVISFDDAETYKEVYPLFDPCYVGYESKSGETIEEMVGNLMHNREV